MAGKEQHERVRRDDGELSPDALTALRTTVDQVLGSHPEVQAAFLFGSAAEGRPFRDLDIALIVDRRASPAERDIELALTVTDELQARSERPVELRVVNDAPSALRYSVTRGVPLVVRSFEAAADFKERTWIEYLDFRPVGLAYLREAG